MTFLKWIFLSSVNANKISDTIKGIIGFVPSIVVFLAMLHLNVDAGSVQSALQAILVLISAVTGAVSAFIAVVGAIRKILTTLNGTNAVLNSQY